MEKNKKLLQPKGTKIWFFRKGKLKGAFGQYIFFMIMDTGYKYNTVTSVENMHLFGKYVCL